MAVFDITVCADESGIHEDASVCVVAGYIASMRQWQQFERAWFDVLQKHDVAGFHAKEFFPRGHYTLRQSSGRGDYRQWPKEKAAAFLGGLLNAVRDFNIQPLGALIDVPAFRALTYGERRYLAGGLFNFQRGKFTTSGAPSRPYHVLFSHCLVQAAHKTKDPKKKVLFVFDEQKQYEGRAIQQFHESVQLLGLWNPPMAAKLGNVIFQSRDGVAGLQVADMLCHCWYDNVTNPTNYEGERRMALSVLMKKEEKIRSLSARDMERLLRLLPAVSRKKLQEIEEVDHK